jgi:hypothetical protein
VVTGPAAPLPGEIEDLLDASWLLACELTDGRSVTVDGGRRGYRVVARQPSPQPRGVELFLQPDAVAAMAGVWAGLFFPVVAVVDAESGRLLRLTRYKGGRAVLRQELRDVADVASADDFAFTPPTGLPVVDENDPSPGARGFLDSLLGGGGR